MDTTPRIIEWAYAPIEVPRNPNANIPLLRKAVEWVEVEDAKKRRGERSEWDQNNWCGTACCVAGHVVQTTGWEMPKDFDAALSYPLVYRNGVSESVSHAAKQELGITTAEAGFLFAASNDAATIRNIAEAIAGEPL